MAQSRDMYINQGKADKKAGMLAKYESAYSWQAKAYLEGFTSVKTKPKKADVTKPAGGAKVTAQTFIDSQRVKDLPFTDGAIPAKDVKELQNRLLVSNKRTTNDYGKAKSPYKMNDDELLEALHGRTVDICPVMSRRMREGKYLGKVFGKHARG